MKEIDMDGCFLLYMLLRPVLFCTLYLDAFRDRLRLSLPVFLGGLAALQLVQALLIERVAGQVDLAVCLYLTAAVNTVYYKLAADVGWDRLLLCVLLASPVISLVQSAGLMAHDRLEGLSAHLVNLLVMLAGYGIAMYPCLLVLRRIKNCIWQAGLVTPWDRRHFLLAMGVLFWSSVSLRDFAYPRSWSILAGRLMIFVVLFYVIYLSFKIIDEVRERQRLSNELAVLDAVYHSEQEYFDMILRSCRDTQQFYHDMRHHGMAVMSYVEQGAYDELKEYLKSYLGELSRVEAPVVLCGNQLIDGISWYWRRRFEAEGAGLACDIRLEELRIRDIDMAIVLGNLLENAFDEVERMLPDVAGETELKLVSKGDMIFLSVTNPCLRGEAEEDYRELEEDFSRFGTGLKNVRRIVEKYQGYMRLTKKAGVFTAKLVLKNA
ncbi:GHKL domain-containing protein [Anaerovibrio sp.]|uniref:sensor histidine kinase n=1 Tax=Anaerovibrio sp. TaxID=1872532 RepID=UPI003F14AE73